MQLKEQVRTKFQETIAERTRVILKKLQLPDKDEVNLLKRKIKNISEEIKEVKKIINMKKYKGKNLTLKTITALFVFFSAEVFLSSTTIATYRTPLQSILNNNSTLIKTESKDTMNKKIIRSIIKSSTETNLDPYLVTCIIEVESSFRINAISRKGAVGLMQVKPSVASSIAEEIMFDGNFDLLSPEDNIRLGTYYLSKLIEHFGDLETALLAYNLGPTRVVESLKSKEKLPERYLKKIKGCYSKFTYTQ
jgi:soluble lytic murein transglycosylase